MSEIKTIDFKSKNKKIIDEFIKVRNLIGCQKEFYDYKILDLVIDEFL